MGEKSKMEAEATRQIRYAVVGAGSIAQEAVLPAFQNAGNSELTALVSGDAAKRAALGKRYGIARTYAYEQYDECLSSGEVNAVYIALPNHLHRQYAERAARAGIHVLCEKPLAPTEEDCRAMIETARETGTNLMTAYRLHFEEANLEAVRVCQSGRLGDLRIFDSIFTQQVADGNVRLSHEIAEGGGPLFDMGVYCINAARYLFREEPVEVSAFRGNNGEKRFRKTEEAMSVMLRFPKDRLATFTVSFGAAPAGRYALAGTKGMVVLDPAYEYSADKRLRVTVDGITNERIFPKVDEFGPELVYFSDCILNNREPEPSGEEGMIDVQIIRAAYRAAEAGRAVPIETQRRYTRPTPEQEAHRPPVEERELLHARMPSGKTKK
jgi:glucose-fructose oxidoreductase